MKTVELGDVDHEEEQEQLGRSERFWNLIAGRRRQPTISRAELERRLAATSPDAQA